MESLETNFIASLEPNRDYKIFDRFKNAVIEAFDDEKIFGGIKLPDYFTIVGSAEENM